MVDRHGDPTTAAQLYQAALCQLGDARDEFRGAVHLAVAHSHLQVDRDREASKAFDHAWRHIGDHGGVPAARLRSTGGEIASRAGDYERADRLFFDALELCEKHGTASDAMLIELSHAKHVLRTQNVEHARTLVYRVGRLVNQLDGNPVGEAAVLELLRQVARGTLTAAALAHTIHRLESPWRYLKQPG